MDDYLLEPPLADYVRQSGAFNAPNNSIQARRDTFARACQYFTPETPSGITIRDQQLGDLAVRLYIPVGVSPSSGFPAVLYLHGGGWSMGSHTTHDWFAFALLKREQFAIVAVDYRLAPEHPFPAPLEDALRVWDAMKNGTWPEIDSHRLAVAGDSAGGSLAAGLCVELKATGMQQPLLQALVYPVLSASSELDSMQRHAQAPMLTTSGFFESLEGHLPSHHLKTDPRALPLLQQSVTNLAPAFIGVAQYDPLFDHGVAYARRLQGAGVPTHLHIGEGLVHASLRASGVPAVEAFYDALAGALGAALASTTI
ncbi:alpha/beta hydrolase [Pseudomonas monteilii]|uniref:alpha/beta hydrolase n=1 Tax=Pseudomonas monteilii TaxID=76759 RepID=UPI003824C715